MSATEFKMTAMAHVSSLAETYCGADIKSAVNVKVFGECVKLLRSKFGELGVVEIHEAFSMAAAQKIKADLTAYGGKFTVAMFGNVLSAYRTFRNAILHKMSEGHGVLEREAEAALIEQKREAYRLHVLGEFARLKNVNKQISKPEDVSLGWARILSDEGLIAPDGELWVQTKLDVRRQFMASIAAGQPDITIGSAQYCRRLAQRLTDDSELFPSDLRQRAVILYGRRLIYKELAAYTGD